MTDLRDEAHVAQSESEKTWSKKLELEDNKCPNQKHSSDISRDETQPIYEEHEGN